MNGKLVLLFAALALSASTAAAQAVSAPCARPDVPASARDFCLSVAQAVESAQPQVGILIAGGNPTIGTASTGGLRLGVLPRVSASANLNVVFVRIPDILAEQAGSAAQRLNDAVGIPAPALSGTVSVGVFPGVSLLPTVGGVGAVDLLGTASWLPLSAAGSGFEAGRDNLAYGGGVRVGLLRESFLTPGISVSLMHRRLGTVQYGNVCEGAGVGQAGSADGYEFETGSCPGGGDPGEFALDLSDWSGRAAIGKRLLGLGLTGGIGYDRFASNVDFGFRAPSGALPGRAGYYARATDIELDNSRWSAFVDASFTLLIATIGAEAGWLQGSEPIRGFDLGGNEFDPGDGTFFGSLGVRLAL